MKKTLEDFYKVVNIRYCIPVFDQRIKSQT
jgi:hypothetical protein